MIDIAFVNETQENTEVYEEMITKLFQKAEELEKKTTYYEVSIIFVTKTQIQDINREYRSIDNVTDVISFALFDEEDGIKDASLISTLGDIFICLEKAQEQAVDYGHSLMREIGFLSVHGLLHLFGYDHVTEEEEQLMFGKQEEILTQLNLVR